MYSAHAMQHKARNEEEQLGFIETAQWCIDYREPGIATTYCIYRRAGDMATELMGSMPDNFTDIVGLPANVPVEQSMEDTQSR